ncbi:AAA family ATPase [Desulfococcaceae bacterium HSG8]|nr:AAA family ATPase [Desulfococcaceae bacterium HSG8]
MTGFTEDEVRTFLNYYAESGMYDHNTDALLELMRGWYGNYKFSNNAERPLFNLDMVLYFLTELTDNKDLPEDMIDQNIRIDYIKLRHLMLTDRKLNGNFSELRKIIEKGETRCRIQAGFPLEHLKYSRNFNIAAFLFRTADCQKGSGRESDSFHFPI